MLKALIIVALAALSSCAGLSRQATRYDAFPPVQRAEGIKVTILDTYYDLGIYGVGLKVENSSGKTINIDDKQAVIVLESGESVSAYTADETRPVWVRNLNVDNFLKYTRIKRETTRAFTRGPLPNGSWREGALYFLLGDGIAGAGRFELVLDGMLGGLAVPNVSLAAVEKIKVKESLETEDRTFLGTKK